MIPVGDATAISFSVVIFTSVGAVIFLGEKMGLHRWTAVFIGFIGTLIIIRPGIEIIEPGVILALASTVFWATGLILTKVLARDDSILTIIFYSTIFHALFTFTVAVYHWVWPTINQLIFLFGIGIMAFLAHLAMTLALKQTDATIIMPIDFTRLLWASVVSYIWFGEFPDLWTWIGSVIVFASTFFITYRESRAKQLVINTRSDLSR